MICLPVTQRDSQKNPRELFPTGISGFFNGVVSRKGRTFFIHLLSFNLIMEMKVKLGEDGDFENEEET